MKKVQLIFALLLVVLFSSCYSSRINYKHMNSIQRGMSPEKVIAILGNPNYRSFDDRGEVLEFRDSEYGTAKVAKIRFVDNKVVEMQGYLDRYYNNCNERTKTTEDDKKKADKEKDTSSGVRVTTDGKHLVKTGSIIVTPDGNHEIVVSDQGGVIITASGKIIHTF